MLSASQPSPAPAKQAYEIIRKIHIDAFEEMRIKVETTSVGVLKNAILISHLFLVMI